MGIVVIPTSHMKNLIINGAWGRFLEALGHIIWNQFAIDLVLFQFCLTNLNDNNKRQDCKIGTVCVWRGTCCGRGKGE
jgi:hypothetical protein